MTQREPGRKIGLFVMTEETTMRNKTQTWHECFRANE